MRLRTSVRPILAFLSAFFLLFAVQGVAAASIDCFKCHDRAAFQKRDKHPPAAEGECLTCHSPHVSRYPKMLQQKVKTLCYSCHTDAAAQQSRGRVHQPVREGKCLSCHDPHSSDHSGLLKKGLADTCFSCHTDMPKKFKYTHPPYAQGKCDACHKPHQSSNPALLVKDSDSLCESCHSLASVSRKHPNFPAKLGKCTSCHNPHGSKRPGMIRNVLHPPYADSCQDCHAGKNKPVTIDTCLGCHPEVSKQMASSHNHLVRFGKNDCMACHSPHAGDDKRMLRGQERDVCGTCHEATFKRHDAAKYKHKWTGRCTDCHAPHGSNHPAMFKAPINDVCANCHEKHSKFTHPIGKTVFDPRTGQMMTCESCHATKGSDFQYHTRYNGSRDLCVQCHRDY
jgi:predicted CXXCH cytochrome family protein